jgi:hypothetical protein
MQRHLTRSQAPISITHWARSSEILALSLPINQPIGKRLSRLLPPPPPPQAVGVKMTWISMMQRTDTKEFVCLVNTNSWELRMRIATTTQDLADLSWSPNGSCFVVWDTPLTYKLLVYSCKGHCLSSYSAYQDALGIRTVQWSPNGQMLAIGSYDQVLQNLLNPHPLRNAGHRKLRPGTPYSAQPPPIKNWEQCHFTPEMIRGRGTGRGDLRGWPLGGECLWIAHGLHGGRHRAYRRC